MSWEEVKKTLYKNSEQIERRLKEQEEMERPISQLKHRLAKIGVDIEYRNNIPWIYLHKVNGKVVTKTFFANHGFTAFIIPVRAGRTPRVVDRRELFKVIRETLSD